MDEDLPFRVDKAGFEAHIAFHGPANWEGSNGGRMTCGSSSRATLAWRRLRHVPRRRARRLRLRPMLFSQGWSRTTAGWKIASWQQSLVIGHVTRQSPA